MKRHQVSRMAASAQPVTSGGRGRGMTSRRGGRLLHFILSGVSGAWLCLAAGCHGPQVKPGNPAAVDKVEMDALQIEVVRGEDGQSRVETYDAPTLFEQGGSELDAQRYAQAAAAYDRIADNFPDSPYAAPALYNAGLSYEGQGRFADAAERYQRLVDRHAGSKQRKDALFRLGACYAEINRWPASDS